MLFDFISDAYAAIGLGKQQDLRQRGTGFTQQFSECNLRALMIHKLMAGPPVGKNKKLFWSSLYKETGLEGKKNPLRFQGRFNCAHLATKKLSFALDNRVFCFSAVPG